MEEARCDHSFGLFLNGVAILLVLGVSLATYVRVRRIEYKLCHPPAPPDKDEAVKIDLTLDEKK